MADNKIIPFMEGRNARLIYTLGRVPKSRPWKTWSIKPNVTKHADGVNGEQRDQLSNTLNFYEITAGMFVRDAEWLQDWLSKQAALDAMTAPLEEAGAIRLNPNNGTRKSFIFQDLIWDDWDLQQGGRAEKKMVNVNMRATDIKEGKTR